MSQQFGSSQKIVVVEDNQALSDIYKTRLELLGYTVFPAYDGVQALAVIEKELPDLVLLDLMVPKIAGDQVLERLRQSDWGKDIKVVIISNLNEADAPAGLRSLGIEAYAVKANLSNDQLDQLVDTVLKPAGQTENVELAQTYKTEVGYAEPSAPPDPATADPLSGTRFQDSPEAYPAPPQAAIPSEAPAEPVPEQYTAPAQEASPGTDTPAAPPSPEEQSL